MLARSMNAKFKTIKLDRSLTLVKKESYLSPLSKGEAPFEIANKLTTLLR